MSALIACHTCDLLVDVSDLQDGCRASCPRCGHFLTKFRADAMNRVLAYSIASIILLILASSFPFLAFSSSGVESIMTLREAPGALWSYGMKPLAILVATFIIYLPALLLLLLVSVSFPLLLQRRVAWLGIAARSIFTLQNWAMVEVFIIGVIVSLVKIAAMATVTLGISFWAYAAFSICFTLAVTSLDRYQCWEAIDNLGVAH